MNQVDMTCRSPSIQSLNATTAPCLVSLEDVFFLLRPQFILIGKQSVGKSRLIEAGGLEPVEAMMPRTP